MGDTHVDKDGVKRGEVVEVAMGRTEAVKDAADGDESPHWLVMETELSAQLINQ